MTADCDPGVLRPVVIRGSAEGTDKAVDFSDYKELQKAMNTWYDTPKTPLIRQDKQSEAGP